MVWSPVIIRAMVKVWQEVICPLIFNLPCFTGHYVLDFSAGHMASREKKGLIFKFSFLSGLAKFGSIGYKSHGL